MKRCFGLLFALLLTVSSAVEVRAVDALKDRVTIVVLDQSGSMKYDLPHRNPPTKASDPAGLRCSAVRLLADLATTRDSLGLVKLESHDDKTDSTADRTAEVLLPPLAMGTEQARTTFKGKIDCMRAAYNTPIADSLQKAFDLLDAVARERGQNSFDGRILLLTDGEPAPQGGVQIEEIDALLPRFAEKGWAVSTVGLKLRTNKLQNGIKLLNRIATISGGTSFGDVDEPLELQHIFVEFFAQQVGRSLQRGRPGVLQPNGEHKIQVADYAKHIDVLVAKDNPQARITLQRPDFSEVNSNGAGVELFSNNDPFYAAFSIDAPTAGTWTVHTDRPTNVIVNVLVTSDLKIRLENATALRASNEPVVLEARFYSAGADGKDAPTTVRNAEVTAKTEILGQSSSMQLHDDGVTPDRVANDGLYSAAITPISSEINSDRLSAKVELSGKSGDGVFTDQSTLQLVALPSVSLTEGGATLRLAPGAPIEVPLRLQLGALPVGPDGWSVRVRQQVGDEQRALEAQRQDDQFVATFIPLPEDQQEYAFVVDLLGVEQNAGLERVGQQMTVRVIFQPTLKLYFEPGGALPAGRPLQVGAALLRNYNQPAAVDAPLRLTVQREDEPAVPVQGSAADDTGMFSYTFTPQQPGRYRFTLLPPADQQMQPITRDVVVEAIPELRWEGVSSDSMSLELHPVSWRWLDVWRRVPLIGPLTSLPVRHLQSERVELRGALLRAEEPYSGTVTLSLLQDKTTVLTETLTSSTIATSWDVPPGSYQVQVDMANVFAPGVDCCHTQTPLVIEQASAPIGQIAIVVGVFGSEFLALLIMWLTGRWYVSPRPRDDDKLLVTVKGVEKAVDLKAAQRIGFVRPRDVDLRKIFRSRGKHWPKQGRVRFVDGGIEYNGQPLPIKPPKSTAQVSPKQIGDQSFLYQPSKAQPWMKTRKAQGQPVRPGPGKPPQKPQPRRHMGLWDRVQSMLDARARSRQRRVNRALSRQPRKSK